VPDFEQKDTSDAPAMTNKRPQQPSEDVWHRPRSANNDCAESPDACELLLTELEARRVRLENLLHSVWLEADTVAARRVPIRPRAKCRNARIKRTG
jgi:hypothetical protein